MNAKQILAIPIGPPLALGYRSGDLTWYTPFPVSLYAQLYRRNQLCISRVCRTCFISSPTAWRF